MSFFSHVLGHDPVLRLLGANHTGHSDGHDGDGLRFGYPMNPGDTLSTIAGKLDIPINELLASNPALRADSPLTPGLDITLPTNHIGHVIDNVAHLVMPNSSTSHEPPPWSDARPPISSAPIDPRPLPTLPGDSHNVMVAPGRGTSDLGTASGAGLISDGSSAPRDVTNSAALTPTQVPSGDRSSYAVVGPTVADESSPATSPADELNFGQAASTTIHMVQSQRDGELPPPPIPQSAESRPLPLFNTSTAQAPWTPQAVPSGWNTVVQTTASDQARLQIMALLAAQIGGAAISNGPATGQTPGFIDPQAVAAYANSMRAGRSIDLGAGRSLQFSLVADQLRRVGAIGEEGRAVSVGSRRTGDGLDEVQQDERTEADQETRDGHEERQKERRRLAAIAAMRRRRRPLSTRCRYWHGERRPLYASGDRRYPKGVDLAEFRSRMPQRYLWTTSPDPGYRGKPRDKR